ncbi:MAG: phage major capsid protein [Actinomycetota bacterium]|nr:phage major capsid protein [Actinomycetota bacterium]
MSIEDQVKDLNAQRLRVWNRGKELLDRATSQGRGLTGEENRSFDAVASEITRLDIERQALLESDEAKRELENVNEELRRVSTPSEYNDARSREKRILADFLSGRTREINIDLRRASYVSNAYRDGARGDDFARRSGIFADTGASGGSLTIPSLVSQTIFQVMQSANIMRSTRMTILDTPTGAPLAIPVGSQGAATQIANQDTTFAGTDPTMASKVLHAYPAGELAAIGNDLITDSGVDVLGWVSQTIAVSVAKLEEQWWVVGTGSNQPQGVMTAGGVGASGTVATGGSLILGPAGAIVEKLIDVQYAVNSRYRAVGEWLTNDATAATMRKLRSDGGGTIGPFLWSPSPTVGLVDGTPDTFMGRPIWVSSNVSAMGSDAKVLAYGDMSYFVAREVGGLQLQTSQEAFFAKNQLGVRGYTRTDSALTDTTAVVTLHQAVT